MDGRFLYGVVPYSEEIELEPGVEGEDVFLVSSDQLAVAVQECSLEPYDTTDKEVVEKWMSQYISILDSLKKRFDNVIPFRFDTILKGRDEGAQNFLEDNHSELREALERVKERQEYVVTIEWKKECKGDEEEIKGGKDFLLRKKAQKDKKEEYEREKKKLREDYWEWLEATSYKMKQENKKDELLRVSLLLSEEEATKVGDVLNEINSREDMSVDFSGPWPPFNFTGLEIGDAERGEKDRSKER